MMLRGLLCTALLLATSAMAQLGTDQAAAAQPATVSPATTQSATAQSASDRPAAGVQPVADTDAYLSPMHVECTPASRASELDGKHGCVAGKVFRITTTKRGDTHLSLCPARSHGGAECSFRVVARGRDSSSIGDLAYLRGRIIAVVGDVTEFRSHPQIIIQEKEQLQVAASEAPQDFDASQRRPGGKGIPGARSVPGVRSIPGVGNGRAW
jgi:hypothetical protein